MLVLISQTSVTVSNLIYYWLDNSNPRYGKILITHFMGRPKEFNQQQSTSGGGGGGGGGTFYSNHSNHNQTSHGDFASSAVSAQAMLCTYYVKIMKN